MKAVAEKSNQQKQSKTVANAVSQQKSNVEGNLEFTDNRAASIFPIMINNSPRMTAQRKKINSIIGNTVQSKEGETGQESNDPVQKKENNTGMPDNLKNGIEQLSDSDMSDIQVHYKSSKPAQLQALAYTQGTDIHVAPGQEKHSPHEAWHVVQQRQGRVKPTLQMKGTDINKNPALEKESDMMGSRAKGVGMQVVPLPSRDSEGVIAHESANMVQQRGSQVHQQAAKNGAIQRAKPETKLFSRERSLTKKLEKAVRKGKGGDVYKHSTALFNQNATYYLALLQYKVNKHKGSNEAKLALYTKNTPGLPALRKAWENRQKYTNFIEEIATLMPIADDKIQMATQDPGFFLDHILRILKQKTKNTSQFLQMLEIGALRDLMKTHEAKKWQRFTADIPQLAVAKEIYKEVTTEGLQLNNEQIIDRIFDAVIQNRNIDVGYYTNNLNLDTVPTILRGATEEEKAARIQRAKDDVSKPSTPSAQCDNLMKILQKVVVMYPGLKTTFAIGMEKQALLTVPLNTLSGGLIPKDFQGNVVDKNGSYTNQIFFTGVTESAEPRSHTWNIIGGKAYDSVLGTKGDQVAASKELAFTQKKITEKQWEKVWQNGNKTLTQLDKSQKTAAPNKLGFRTAYQRSW